MEFFLFVWLLAAKQPEELLFRWTLKQMKKKKPVKTRDGLLGGGRFLDNSEDDSIRLCVLTQTKMYFV